MMSRRRRRLARARRANQNRRHAVALPFAQLPADARWLLAAFAAMVLLLVLRLAAG
jgi:hypothetical protein